MPEKNENRPAKRGIPKELKELEKGLKSTNPKVFDGVSNKKKQEILQSLATITVIQEKMHLGPLPDSQTLIEYNQVIPNGADRIMIMAENQQKHRMAIQDRLVKSQTLQSLIGQIFGLILGLAGLGCGTFLAYNGHTTVGGIIAGTTVVSLVSVFVIGRRLGKKSKEDWF